MSLRRQTVPGRLLGRAAAIGLAMVAASVILGLALALRKHKTLLAHARQQLLTDPLTGLANRKKLLLDLEAVTAGTEQHLFVIYDLNGFKHFNDTFGHPRGDVLLTRLAHRLRDAVGPLGCAYRLGGDEFCVLAASRTGDARELVEATQIALSEFGPGFRVSSSFGLARLPEEAGDCSSALALADERLYQHKKANDGDPFPDLLGRAAAREKLA